MTYYQNDENGVRKLFEKYFSKVISTKNAIDYWAEYFSTIIEADGIERNFKLAQLFNHCPSKRVEIHRKYNSKLSIEKQLMLAKTDYERANVYLMHLTRKLDCSLDDIKKIAELTPNSPFLDYLIVREVNKFEDWILTPRYSMFPPSIVEGYYDTDSKELLKKRISKDLKRLKDFRSWVSNQSSDLSQIASAYLAFISEDNVTAKKTLEISKNSSNDWIAEFSKKIKLLIDIREGEISNNDIVKHNLDILDGSTSFLSREFYFAIAREYEEINELTMAVLFFSHVNEYTSEYGYNYLYPIPWKGKNKIKSRYYLDFSTSYFSYIDEQFSATSIVNIIKELNRPSVENDWLYKYLKNDIGSLLDLLGTKYIREDKIDSASIALQKVPDSIWKQDSYVQNLNCNPFYTDLYTEHKGSKADTVVYTKVQVIDELLRLKNEFKNTSSNKASKIAFKIANCYLNMSYHGNSWIMQNYYWTGSRYHYEGITDDYLTNERAKKYYLLAMDSSSNKKVKALCLRMAGRCEKYKLYQMHTDRWSDDYSSLPGGYEEFIFTSNKYYIRLKNEFGEDYEPLISNCESFNDYYNFF